MPSHGRKKSKKTGVLGRALISDRFDSPQNHFRGALQLGSRATDTATQPTVFRCIFAEVCACGSATAASSPATPSPLKRRSAHPAAAAVEYGLPIPAGMGLAQRKVEQAGDN
jgi:hypothetical protein